MSVGAGAPGFSALEGTMARTDAERRRIFDRTAGRCHLCGKTLSWRNYAQCGARGAWEVDHSRPRAKGGSNHGSNLFAACVGCNRAKGARFSRSHRAGNGLKRAPMSKTERAAAREKNAWTAGIGGALAGAALLGPAGALVLGTAAAVLGWDNDPEGRR